MSMSRPQTFPVLPSTIMHYLLKTPKSHCAYGKCIKLSKSVYIGNPIILAEELYIGLDFDRISRGVIIEAKNNESQCISMIPKSLQHRLWITSELAISFVMDPDVYTSVISKVYRFDMVKVLFAFSFIYFDDFCHIIASPAVKDVQTLQCSFLHKDGSLAFIEDIMAKLTNCSVIHIGEGYAVEAKSSKNFAHLPMFPLLEEFKLTFVNDEIKPSQICDFIKKHGKVNYIFLFKFTTSKIYRYNFKAALVDMLDVWVDKTAAPHIEMTMPNGIVLEELYV